MVTKYKFDDVETLAIYVIDEIIKNCKREVLDGNFNRDDYKILPKVS